MRIQIAVAECLLFSQLLFAQSDPADKSIQDLLATRTELMQQFGEANAPDRIDQATAIAQQLRKIEEKLIGQLLATKPEDKKLGLSVVNTLTGTITWLVDYHEDQDQVDEAMEAQRTLIPWLIELHGAGHYLVTDANLRLSDLELYSSLKIDERLRLKEAVRLLSKGLEKFKVKQFSESLELQQEALAIRREILGENHPLVANVCFELGMIYGAIGDPIKELEFLRRAERLQRQMLGLSNPIWQRTVESLLPALDNSGMHALSEEYFEDALRLQAERLARTLDRYGEDDWRVLDVTQSSKLVERISSLSRDDRDLLNLNQTSQLNELSVQQYNKHEYAAAEKSARTALATRDKLLGPESPLSLVSVENLAIYCRDQGQLAESISLFRELTKRRLKAQGSVHPKLRESRLQLTKVLRSMAESAEEDEEFDLARVARSELISELNIVYGPRDYRVTDEILAAKHTDCLISLSPSQRKRFAAVTELSKQVLDTQQSGRFADGIEPAVMIVEILRELFGEQHRDYATSLNNLGMVYENMGDYARAEPLLTQAMAIRKVALGEQHPDYATSLNNLAVLYKDMDDYGQAERHYKQAMTILKIALGEQHPDYATSLSNLAALYRKMGEYMQAEPLFNQAIAIEKVALGEQHPDYGTSLNNLAELYREMGEYARAEPLYNQAMAIWKIALGELHPDYATSLNNLAAIYQQMGDYARAEPLYIQALAIWKVALGEQHPDHATSLNNLAMLYENMGDYARAEPLYNQGMAIRKVALGEQHRDYASSLNNLAFLYQQMGDYARAEPLYIQALAIWKVALGEQHPDYARSVNNLATLYRDMVDYTRAEPLYNQAIKIRKAALGEQHPDYATSLDNLASLYESMREYARAEPLYDQAMVIRKVALGEQHPDYATSLNNLGGLYMDMGEYARAEPLYNQAIAIQKVALGDQHPSYATSLNNLAVLYNNMGDNARAVFLCERMLSITRKHLDETAYVLSERQQLAMNQSVRYQFDNYLRCCLASPYVPPKAVENVLLWKGSILFRLRGLRIAADEPAITEQFGKLQQAAARLSKLAQAFPDPKQAEGWKGRVAKLSAEKEQLEAKLMQSSAVFRQAVEHISLGQIQQAIPEDGVLIDYLEFAGKDGRSLLVSIVKHDAEPVMVALGSANEVSEAIDVWRETFGMSPKAKEAGLKLRRQIWQPVVEHLGSAKTILVSTDGVLGRLPLAALPGKESGTYLIEDHRIALIPVPQLLPALVNEKARKKLKREMMLMGDVDYDTDPNQDHGAASGSAPPRKRPSERSELPEAVRGDVRWNALFETRSEVEYIAGLYKRLYQPSAEAVLDLRKSAASETAFRIYAPECEFLHLATHGFFASPDAQSALSTELVAKRGKDRDGMFGQEREVLRGHNPGQLSGIVFAGVNRKPDTIDPLSNQDQPDDGIMTADEIAFLRLEGVRLAVLSACETGLGEVAGGEGLLGIQRGFQIAGARSIVASLWKVNDAATRRLMQEFYTNYLDKEMGMLDALRETQLWALKNPAEVPRGMMRETESETPTRLPPQYWAPFVLSGDWR